MTIYYQDDAVTLHHSRWENVLPDLQRVVAESWAEPRSNPGVLIEDVAAEPVDAVMLILDVADEIRAFLAGEPA